MGSQVRKLRREIGITGGELARRIGVSTSLISQIERGSTSPSIEVLRRLATALGVQIGVLFFEKEQVVQRSRARSDSQERTSGAHLVRKNERVVISFPESNIRYELLSPNLRGQLEFIWMEIGPGDRTRQSGQGHEGEESFLILEGSALFHYGGDVWEMHPGDAITIDSSVPHYLTNPHDDPLRAVSVVTPPSF